MKHRRAPEISERSVRVFVSSTFRDMHAERDELVKHVFPQLRALCAERDASFVDIDLRWGVTKEDAAEGRVLPICLAEIDASRPFFIGILGERYGWIPDAIGEDLMVREPWLREHLSSSVTEMEIVHGVLNDRAMSRRAFFYLRDPAYLEAMPAALRQEMSESQPEMVAKLENLKNRIRQSGLPVREGFASPNQLGKLVYADLSAAIEEMLPPGSAPDPTTREREQHRGHAVELSRIHVGGERYFGDLDGYVFSDAPLMVVVGESGLGKSALLATWSLRAEGLRASAILGEPDARAGWETVDTFVHFVGVGSHSISVADTLRRITQELALRYEVLLDVVPEEGALRETFARVLQLLPRDRRIVIVIDAVNQMVGSTGIDWLPSDLPPNVRVVLSTIDIPPLEAPLPLGTVTLTVTPLSQQERLELTTKYLGRYSKSLGPEEIDRVANTVQCASPLFLVTMLDELRVLGRFEELDARIEEYLSADSVPDLLDLVLQRWEQDYEQESPGLVGRTMRLLWASRRGMHEADVLKLLGDGDAPLPQAVFAPFRLAAGRSLTIRYGRVDFSHDYLRQAVERRYFTDRATCAETHARLADYFSQNDPDAERNTDAVWHLMQAAEWECVQQAVARPCALAQMWTADPVVALDAWTGLEERGLTPYLQGDTAASLAALGNDLVHIVDLLSAAGSNALASQISQFAAANDASFTPYGKANLLRSGAIATMNAGDTKRALEMFEMAEAELQGARPTDASLVLFYRTVAAKADSLLAAGRDSEAARDYELVASAGWLMYDERLLNVGLEGSARAAGSV